MYKWPACGFEVRKTRNELGLTPDEMAEKLKCTRQFVSRMELGQAVMPVEKMKLLSKYVHDTRIDAIISAYLRDVKFQIRKQLG